eukprot:6211202-Pleurochrysis_carterae.AAC.4
MRCSSAHARRSLEAFGTNGEARAFIDGSICIVCVDTGRSPSGRKCGWRGRPHQAQLLLCKFGGQLAHTHIRTYRH